MFVAESSVLKDSDRTVKYALAALYAPPAIKLATDETFITTPELRSFIAGSATCIKRIGVRTRTFKTSSSFAKSLIVNALLIPKPALLIRTSISFARM